MRMQQENSDLPAFPLPWNFLAIDFLRFCFESQKLQMGNLTLFAGLNGMGKSSVIQALLLLRQSYLDGLLPETGLELNGSLVQMGAAKDVLSFGRS
jgi:predicted ATPase